MEGQTEDRVENGIRKAVEFVDGIYTHAGEGARLFFTMSFTGEQFYDGSGYKILAVHAARKAREDLLEKCVLKHLNHKYELNGIKVYGHFGLNFVSEVEGGIIAAYAGADTYTKKLMPLIEAIKEFIHIISSGEFKELNDALSEKKKNSVENAEKEAISKLEKILHGETGKQ